MNSSRKMLRAKLHSCTVNEADVNYEGSISVPLTLMKAADIKPYEACNVWNVTRGTRFETYVIEGPTEGQESLVTVNGAAAHLVELGDRVIVALFADIPESQVASHKPTVVFVDENNQIKEIGPEVPGPKLRQVS